MFNKSKKEIEELKTEINSLKNRIKCLENYLNVLPDPRQYIYASNGTPPYSFPPEGPDGRDELFEQTVRIVCQHDMASASLIQRRLQIGFNRAARLLEQLEEAGVVGLADGSKPREVLVKNADEFFDMQKLVKESSK